MASAWFSQYPPHLFLNTCENPLACHQKISIVGFDPRSDPPSQRALDIANVAVTEAAALMVTVQVAVAPVHAPDQPANTDFPTGLASSVTLDPGRYDSEQSLPQEIPAGFDVTVPLPDPAIETVSR